MDVKTTFLVTSIFLVLSVGCISPNEPKSARNVATTTSPDQSFKIAVVSDMNRSYGSTEYHQGLKKAIKHIIDDSQIKLVLSTGDMVAGQKSTLSMSNIHKMWDAFHEVVTTPLNQAGIAFAPSPGNHDASIGKKFKRERDKYRDTWLEQGKNNPLPKMIDGDNFPFNYAFTYGPAVIISLDATKRSTLGNEQFEWLTEILEKTKDTHSFKIIFGHVPLYPFAIGREAETIAFGTVKSGYHKKLEALLEHYKVNLFLSGHHHAYYPGHRKGFVSYISTPLLGTGARPLLTPSGKGPRSANGFLIIEYNSKEFTFQSIQSKDLKQVAIESLPKAIQVPAKNSKKCKYCASFSKAFFLEPDKRLIYHRLDLRE